MPAECPDGGTKSGSGTSDPGIRASGTFRRGMKGRGRNPGTASRVSHSATSSGQQVRLNRIADDTGVRQLRMPRFCSAGASAS